MSREQIQRLALVVLVVLLAAVASERLLAMVQPSCSVASERTVHVRIHEAPRPLLAPLPPLPPHTGVHAEAAAEAQRMAEARRMAEEHRRIAREHVVVVR